MECIAFVICFIGFVIGLSLIKKREGYILLKPKSEQNDEQLARYIYWQIKNENKED